MNTVTTIESALLQAYLDTLYSVRASPDVVLRVGTHSPGLRDIHLRHGVASSAFITAWNPFSEPVDAATNAKHQELLAEELRWQGLAFLPGIGQHPSNQWPGEESFLVLGVSLEAAKEFGKCHGQNAILWADADAIPQLVLLR